MDGRFLWGFVMLFVFYLQIKEFENCIETHKKSGHVDVGRR